MIQATFTLPKLETRHVWAGLYGGHYDCIVFFKSKPKKFQTEFDWQPPKLYDVSGNEHLVVGCMYLGEFEKYFPNVDLSRYTQKSGRPRETEPDEVFQMALTTLWSGDKMIFGIQFDVDGWTR